MLIKCAVKYMVVGMLVIYGTVTINMLSWISNKHLANKNAAWIQGQNTIFLTANHTQTSYESIDENHYSNQDLYNHVLFENSVKRKRKILAEIIHEYHINQRNPNDKNLVFKSIGNISVFSAYYDDRDNLDHDAPVVRIMAISKLDSTENLVCRYTNRGFDPWILATKYEMCENHGKQYGGFMYLCNAPLSVEIIPRKVYLQSLSGLSTPVTETTDSYISLDLLPINRKKVSTLMDDSDISTQRGNKFHQSSLEGKYSLENIVTNDPDTLSQINKKLADAYILREKDKLKFNLKQNLRKHGLIDKTSDTDFEKEMIVKNNENKDNTQDKAFKIAVCVPPLFGSIKISNFIQFIELVKIQQVDQVFVYVMNISSDMNQLLKYYEKQKILTQINWKIPEETYDYIWYNGQIISIQDCLYRTMSGYHYTAFIDIDEIIIPRNDFDWPKLLQRLEKDSSNSANTQTAGFSFQSAFFDPENVGNDSQNTSQSTNISKLSFLRSRQRNDVISKVRTKLIAIPEEIVEMGIHHISRTVNQTYNVTTYDVSSSTALIHHYRKCTTQSDENMQCGEQYIVDKSVLKYEHLLNRKYQTVVKEMLKSFKKL